MKITFMSVLIVIVLLGLVGCAQPSAGEIVKSEKQRMTSPGMSEADLAEMVDANSNFAFDMYQVLREESGNFFYSPYSISLALAMTYGGARGETAHQMADSLHFTLLNERLHPAFNRLDMELSQRGEGAKGKDGKGFKLNIVNAIWGQEDYEFIDTFLDLLAENYGAEVRTLDFASEPEDSRIVINNWVSDQTEDLIEDLIPQGIINTLTRLVLTNAIYFSAAWQHPLSADMTSDGPFYLLDAGEVIVPLMRQRESFGYAEGDDYQAVELPYDGRELSMLIILPKAGQFEIFEGSLDIQLVDDIVKRLEPNEIRVIMPKFTYESEFKLKDTLSDLGMIDAFLPEVADFSGMDGTDFLFIRDVIHQTFVAVDEAGTEAAAATAVMMELESMPTVVSIDHPFVFLIRDIKTGSIIFIGRVLDPST